MLNYNNMVTFCEQIIMFAKCKFIYTCVIMVDLCNRADHYIFILFLSSYSSFFSSPYLSSRRLDVYHTLAHGVALVQI